MITEIANPVYETSRLNGPGWSWWWTTWPRGREIPAKWNRERRPA